MAAVEILKEGQSSCHKGVRLLPFSVQKSPKFFPEHHHSNMPSSSSTNQQSKSTPIAKTSPTTNYSAAASARSAHEVTRLSL